MMENVYDGYRAAQVTEMLAQLSKPDADNGHGKELRNFNALPNNVYYVTEAPVYISFGYIVALNMGTLILCLLMLLVPSYIITKISPVKAIRFD